MNHFAIRLLLLNDQNQLPEENQDAHLVMISIKLQ